MGLSDKLIKITRRCVHFYAGDIGDEGLPILVVGT